MGCLTTNPYLFVITKTRQNRLRGPSRSFLINPELISIGKGTVIEPGAYIKGPCIIGENCTVRHGAYIRGDFIAGNNCVIGHDTEVKNCVMLNDARAGHFAYLGDTVVGNDVNLGAGTKCANLKLDGRPIIVHCEGTRIATGVKKFGAILGDGAQTGCNTVTNPGTLLEKMLDAIQILLWEALYPPITK